MLGAIPTISIAAAAVIVVVVISVGVGVVFVVVGGCWHSWSEFIVLVVFGYHFTCVCTHAILADITGFCLHSCFDLTIHMHQGVIAGMMVVAINGVDIRGVQSAKDVVPLIKQNTIVIVSVLEPRGQPASRPTSPTSPRPKASIPSPIRSASPVQQQQASTVDYSGLNTP
jgi:hypothetical protein